MKRNAWMRWVVAFVALGVAVYLFWPLLKEVRAAARLFRDARWEWLAAAVALQIASYSCLTWFNVLALRPFAGKIGFWRLMLLLTSLAFITAAVPSAGASGFVLRARLLGRHGFTAEASTFTLLLELLYLVVGTILLGVIGLGYLLQRGTETWPEVVVMGALALAAGGLVWAGWLLLSEPRRSLRLARSLTGSWNRLAARLHVRAIDPVVVEERLEAFHAGLRELVRQPRWKFAATVAGRILLDVATLGACFAGLGRLVRPDILLIGYGLILVISVLAVVPGGLGLADVSLPVVFNRLGVPGPLALAAGLAYRLLAFWLIRFIGFVGWQVLETPKDRRGDLKEGGGVPR
jgi:putative heme transporter